MRKEIKLLLAMWSLRFAFWVLPKGNLKNELAIWIEYYLDPENQPREIDGFDNIDQEIAQRKKEIEKEESHG